jgi:hypothetical protein
LALCILTGRLDDFLKAFRMRELPIKKGENLGHTDGLRASDRELRTQGANFFDGVPLKHRGAALGDTLVQDCARSLNDQALQSSCASIADVLPIFPQSGGLAAAE